MQKSFGLVYNFGLSECSRANPIALRRAKMQKSFGLSECKRVKGFYLEFQ